MSAFENTPLLKNAGSSREFEIRPLLDNDGQRVRLFCRMISLLGSTILSGFLLALIITNWNKDYPTEFKIWGTVCTNIELMGICIVIGRLVLIISNVPLNKQGEKRYTILRIGYILLFISWVIYGLSTLHISEFITSKNDGHPDQFIDMLYIILLINTGIAVALCSLFNILFISIGIMICVKKECRTVMYAINPSVLKDEPLTKDHLMKDHLMKGHLMKDHLSTLTKDHLSTLTDTDVDRMSYNSDNGLPYFFKPEARRKVKSIELSCKEGLKTEYDNYFKLIIGLEHILDIYLYDNFISKRQA